jgi:hypothetical protein
MTASGGAMGGSADVARVAKPVGDLMWSKDGSTFAGLTTAANVAAATSADAVVESSPRGTYDNAQTIQYRMKLSYADDTPGTYTLGFNYTIIAN